MLGEGIVSFGTAAVTVSRRKAKSSPKIVSARPSLPSTSLPAEIPPAAASSRARTSAGGLSRLPTWSARNGGDVRAAMSSEPPSLVAVLIRLVRPLDRDAEVRRLLGCQLRQPGAERLDVQPG